VERGGERIFGRMAEEEGKGTSNGKGGRRTFSGRKEKSFNETHFGRKKRSLINSTALKGRRGGPRKAGETEPVRSKEKKLTSGGTTSPWGKVVSERSGRTAEKGSTASAKTLGCLPGRPEEEKQKCCSSAELEWEIMII